MSGYVCHVNENIEGAVYIGRANGRRGLKASPFANPYAIGRPNTDVPEPTRRLLHSPMGREGVLFAYATEFWRGELSHLIERLPELRGKPLACWCRTSDTPFGNGANGTHDNRCHGDLLVDWLESYTDDQLRNFMKENV